MFRGGTVKQFKDALEEMKKIYPYDEEKTRLSTIDNPRDFSPVTASIITTDESTGIVIQMHKDVKEDYE